MTYISPFLYKYLDDGRRADVARLEAKLLNPATPDGDRKRIEDALYAIRDQAKYKSIEKDRDKLRIATLNKDKERTERLGEHMKKTYDGDYTNYGRPV